MVWVTLSVCQSSVTAAATTLADYFYTLNAMTVRLHLPTENTHAEICSISNAHNSHRVSDRGLMDTSGIK